jgi:hypothetical protein
MMDGWAGGSEMQKVLFSTLLGLGLVVLVLAAPGLAQSSDVPALVRIDLMGPDDLARVAALDLPVHAHLTAPGADYLLAVLTPQQQKQLRSLNLALTVLDPDARDAIYYLIESGRPQMAGRVAPAFTIVHDDGRQAVGRLREGVAFQAMDDLSMPVARLSPDPIVLTPRATGIIPTIPLYDPLIAGLLAQITTASVAGYDRGLSGGWPVLVGGEPYALTTRYTYSGEPIAKATQYVYEHMQALGYNVSYHNYTLSYHNLRNVIGEKRGLVHPDQIFLLTAHLDSRAASWPHNPAPGADDNASGSTALMIAADLLAVLDFEYTIRIVFFTGEEQGMWGSYYYARDMAGAEENILGVLNLDMIAWDARYGPDIDLHSHLPSVEDDSDALADLFAAVVDVYNLNLQPQIVENGALFSDHSRFWDRGYAAILAIEDYYNSNEVAAEPRDWNTNYHTVNDRLSTLNLEYFREYVRASVATFVHLASPVPTMISGTVTCAETSAPLSATVTAAGQEGVFSGVTDASGTYSILLRPGLYTVTVSAHGYYPQTLTDVAVLAGNDTQVNFALEPLPTFTVSGTVTDAVGGQLLSATVRFDDYAITAPNGFYSATLPGGAYLVTVSAPFHYPTTRTVAVDHDQRQDFALQPTPCLLVVDDDYDNAGNSHDDQVFYTATLETMGVGYDLWAVPDDADGPPLEILSRYQGVIWLTGRDWDRTLTWADQGALAAYLDGGGRLFLSGQDVGWDVARNGEPPFYRDHLHADYLRDDSGYRELTGADFLSGIAVTIEGGDGADNQKYPSDVGVVGDGAGVFRYPDGDWAASAYADDSHRAVYFAFGFEGINNAADRRAVMQRVLNYLAPCSLSTLPYDFALQSTGIRFGERGESVTHTVTIANVGALGDAHNLELSAAAWTTTLPFARSVLLPAQQQIEVSLTVAIPFDAERGDHDQVVLTVTSVYSPVHAAHVVLHTVVGHEVYLPLLLSSGTNTAPDVKP